MQKLIFINELILKWKKVRGQKPLTETEMGIAEQLIKTKYLAIVDKWNLYLFLGRLLNEKNY